MAKVTERQISNWTNTIEIGTDKDSEHNFMWESKAGDKDMTDFIQYILSIPCGPGNFTVTFAFMEIKSRRVEKQQQKLLLWGSFWTIRQSSFTS